VLGLQNAISKQTENHAHMTSRLLQALDFVRVRKTLRSTPFVAAGVTYRHQEVADMVKLQDWKVRQT
jgi:hypothetical protein